MMLSFKLNVFFNWGECAAPTSLLYFQNFSSLNMHIKNNGFDIFNMAFLNQLAKLKEDDRIFCNSLLTLKAFELPTYTR
jgi:hypothetical protein